ncbi:MAG: hypothetical protein CMJ75_22305 [Planctomycetaceae bacterium]|nr:hypothetical protein [Planctomycetaceae bacterium]
MRVSESKLVPVLAASVIGCVVTLLPGSSPGQDPPGSADNSAPGNRSGVLPLDSEGNYLRFSHQAGRGLGFRDASTAVGGFLPLAQREMGLGFLDAQLLVTNHGRLGMNAGLGYRWLTVDESRLWDASLWFDLEDTEQRTLHQLGASVSTIGTLESRVNFYAPLDRDAHMDAVLTETTFQGNDLWVERTIWRTTPMLGVEAEVGGAAPGLDNALFGYLGAYSFDTDAGISANGFMARLEIEPVPSLLAFARLRSDSVFGTTVMLGGSVFFPAPAGSRRRPELRTRMFHPVRRNHRISRYSSMEREHWAAVNAETGQPYRVVHVDSQTQDAPVGTFEQPLASLDEAVGSDANLIFVRAGSLFENLSLSLQDGQALLGEGEFHWIDDLTAGPVLLPQRNLNAELPVLSGSAILLANGNEIAGWKILDSAADAIYGNDIQDFQIHHNLIDGSGESAIRLEGARGNGLIAENVISHSGVTLQDAPAVLIATANDDHLNVQFQANLVEFNNQRQLADLSEGSHVLGHTVQLSARDESNLVVEIQENVLAENSVPHAGVALENQTGVDVTIAAGNAIQIDADDTAVITGQVTENTLLDNGRFSGVANNAGQLTLLGGNGLVVDGQGQSRIELVVDENAFSGNGFLQDVSDSGQGLQWLAGSAVVLRSATDSAAVFDIALRDNTIRNNGFIKNLEGVEGSAGYGLLVEAGSSGLDVLRMFNNEFDLNGDVVDGIQRVVGVDVLMKTLADTSQLRLEIAGNTARIYRLDNTSGGVFEAFDGETLEAIDLLEVASRNSGVFDNYLDGAMPDFLLTDVNDTSPQFGLEVSPRDYLGGVSAWYFGHSTCGYCRSQFVVLTEMQGQLDEEYPELAIDIIGMNEAGYAEDNAEMTAAGDLPWLQDVDQDNNGLSDVWRERWNITWRDVLILDSRNAPVGVFSLSSHNLNSSAAYSTLLDMLLDAADLNVIP